MLRRPPPRGASLLLVACLAAVAGSGDFFFLASAMGNVQALADASSSLPPLLPSRMAGVGVGVDGGVVDADAVGGSSGRRQLLQPSDLDPSEQQAQKALEFRVMLDVFATCANHSIASYSRKAGWGEPDLSNWYGVGLDDGGFVTSLNVPSAHLKCEIPPVLGQLIFLESLVLSNNELIGTLPTDLGRLTNLHTLNLMGQRRKLVGSIPAEVGLLTDLRYLDMSYNSLTMPIPESVGSLHKLQVLELSNNFINGTFPESLRNLDRLEVFNVKHNALTSDVAHLYELLPQFKEDTANTQFWMSNIFRAGGEQDALFQQNDV